MSAAAGSGKTSVLAERCAYLACEAPRGVQCDVDRLLVLTFTDAAAGEMRSRIIDAIRFRTDERPDEQRLREQMHLVEAAQISTIHSFCLWLVRRWFSHIGVDPSATVLGADEETLLKAEVLDDLFSELYAPSNASDKPLGQVTPERSRTPEPSPGGDLNPAASARTEPAVHQRSTGASSTELSSGFVRLVDDYGLGEDRDIARFVLKLYDFLSSLPDPDAWLAEARDRLSSYPDHAMCALLDELAIELERQVEHCERLAENFEAGHAGGHFHASQVRAYADQLRAWAAQLQAPGDGKKDTGAPSSTDPEVQAAMVRFESIRRQIADFEFSRARGPRLSKDADPALRATRDAASASLSSVKKNLFAGRLEKRFALFSVAETIAGLRNTAPYVSTVADLVRAFRDAYTRKKRELNVLDFADLERFALELLCDHGDPGRPSDIARKTQRRYVYVLVDEFQDINPIQKAIIGLVSRESDPDQRNNLFVVGDIKQSIYRFRLAEPAIFNERMDRFGDGGGEGTTISLQANFRSRPEILDAVNTVFRALTRKHWGGFAYDDDAELRPGRETDPDLTHEPVELHLLERSWPGRSGDEDEVVERGVADLSDPARWTAVEREAFLIGAHIRSWMSAGEPAWHGSSLRYRDVAVLLRAAKVNAERVAAMLGSMGIPAYADVGGSLFGAREVRDTTAALEVLDNLQQDIPLTALLRSGIMAEPFSEDDLVEIRCLDRDTPFHAAVRKYAACGPDTGLRERLHTLFDRIERFRIDARRRPLADVLWRLYEQHGYLAYAGGLPNGAQRRANLLKLHELARRFASFRRQGLHRFLRFIRSLEEQQQGVASAPAIGEGEDVVRVMSIHQSKGLEFPVVFVAGLGTKFNLGDRSGRMIFERTSKIGLRIVDTERMIEYDSAAHRLVASEIEQAAREEELRILYVAMTRARDKLVLVGSRREVMRYSDTLRDAGPERPASLLSLATAATPLDWLLPALAGAPAGLVDGLGGHAAEQPLFKVRVHDVDEMTGWRTTPDTRDRGQAVRQAASQGEALPGDEPLAPDDPVVDQVLGRIDFVYPQLASASVRASIAASELRQPYDFLRNPEQREARSRDDDFSVPTSKYASLQPDEAAHRGVVTHRVLQHLDFAAAVDARGVGLELQRMVEQDLIDSDDCKLVDEASVTWFISTPLAEAIRGVGDRYRREFSFIATEPLSYVDRSIGPPPDDRVLVRGIVDGILPVEAGIEIVDFKTDVIQAEEVAERAERYRPQMTAYARAMSQIWRQPVAACWLVFLSAKRCHVWGDGTWAADTALTAESDEPPVR